MLRKRRMCPPLNAQDTCNFAIDNRGFDVIGRQSQLECLYKPSDEGGHKELILTSGYFLIRDRATSICSNVSLLEH